MSRYNFVLILLLAVSAFWLILTEDYSLANIVVAFLIGIITLFITQLFILDSENPNIQLSLIGCLILYFLKVLLNIFISSFRVLQAVIKNKSNVDRVTIHLPTEYGLINSLICNSITLTPGTITLEMQGSRAEVLVLNPEFKSQEILRHDIESSYERLKNL